MSFEFQLLLLRLLAHQSGPPAPAASGTEWVSSLLTSLLDRGPLGLAVILMVALWWVFRYEEKKLVDQATAHETKVEKMRSDFRDDYNTIREENKQLLVKATEVVSENNTLLGRIASLLERGQR